MIAKLPIVASLLLVLVRAGPAARNLLVNGDFSQSLNEGWVITTDAYEPVVEMVDDNAGGARVLHQYQGATSLSQLLPVRNLDLGLKFSARFRAWANKPDYGASAAIAVAYCDRDTQVLGQTLFYHGFQRPLLESRELHVVLAGPDSTWQSYELDLRRDINENLPAVEAARVAFVRVSLLADNGDKEGC
jgi:hypothetical protein